MPDPIKTFYDAASAVETPLGCLDDLLIALDLWGENVEREALDAKPVKDWAPIQFVKRFHNYMAQYQSLMRDLSALLAALRAADDAIYKVAFKERREKEENQNA